MAWCCGRGWLADSIAGNTMEVRLAMTCVGACQLRHGGATGGLMLLSAARLFQRQRQRGKLRVERRRHFQGGAREGERRLRLENFTGDGHGILGLVCS